MMKSVCLVKSSLYLTVLLLIPVFSQAQQELRGVVLDNLTQEPLSSVAVYLNGTTKGVITNDNGKFIIEVNNTSNESLVISYLGYQNVILEQSKIKDRSNIVVYLKKQLETLDPVFLKDDGWSRAKKMYYFRKCFIGEKDAQEDCKILNENDIKLFYNSVDNKLYATTYAPLRIKNDFLGYSIFYDLFEFEIQFEKESKESLKVYSVFYLGTSFYKDLIRNKQDVDEYQKRREIVYQGSVLHFMRSLADKKLRKNKFELIDNGKRIKSKKVFNVENKNGFAEVQATQKKIDILYSSTRLSRMQFNNKKSSFVIDGFGNYRPLKLFYFSGYMGELKLGRMLPLDYGLEQN